MLLKSRLASTKNYGVIFRHFILDATLEQTEINRPLFQFNCNNGRFLYSLLVMKDFSASNIFFR